MLDQVHLLLDGDRRALARLLTAVENEREGVETTLAALYPHTGRAWVIGITGAPGTGKSSLVTALAKAYRTRGESVGILAVDPTSPFTGGAILGDRIRMRDLAGDKNIFIRSMATRGSLGGLSRATRDAIRVLDAAGFQRILVETVGAGQSEIDIVRAAHTTLVIEAPGLGDDVQAIKAGILEIADVLVINKADRPGVEHTARALKSMLELGHPASRVQSVNHHGQMIPTATPAINKIPDFWLPPIIRTVAIENQGVDEVVNAIETHRTHLSQAGKIEELEDQHIQIELVERLREHLLRDFFHDLPPETFAQAVAQIRARTKAPQTAVQELLALRGVNVAK
ncbi:MAG: methylmalonyl Co-A mutase-associated GTPase MeaB [Anaerolineae bacterium]|nr:methylmalonyl Co-A mutase-associated GTPase MeaB [Anaerolineae bacterium]MBN8617600.1 methylmalonyl Co-A mutase-associated GTPase MeaB [Anaerolineae bacterium]